MNKLLVPRSRIVLIRRAVSTPPVKTDTPEQESPASKSLTPRYRPSEFQKFILVWTKKYKSKEEIPQYVSPDLIDRSRSEARIKISNRLMILTALASLGAIIAGKRAAKRGESVHQMNLDWHKQYDDDYAKKESASKK